MIEKLDQSKGRVIGFRFSGKLTHEDYQKMIPAFEEVIEREGKIRAVIHLKDFDGWELHAAWDDFVFGLKHYKDFEAIAVIGGDRLGDWIARVAKPFTNAKVRHFQDEDLPTAWAWLEEFNTSSASQAVEQ